MARRLKTYIHINVDGAVQSYGPGDDVPADVAKGIGDHAWEGEDADVKPARSDTKAAWVDHAVAQGMAREDAESMTKEDLISEVG